ncbi:MAG: hypothetical protein QXE25_04335 [Nitrososphaerota archaeon]
MGKISDYRLEVWIPKDLKDLAMKVARARGETLGAMVRRALKKELALMNYLSEEEKKALGVLRLREVKTKDELEKEG